jgi:hypothetical protein
MEFFTSSLSDPADSQVEDHGIFNDYYGQRISGLEENRLSHRLLPTMPSATIDFIQQFRLPAKDSLQQ